MRDRPSQILKSLDASPANDSFVSLLLSSPTIIRCGSRPHLFRPLGDHIPQSGKSPHPQALLEERTQDPVSFPAHFAPSSCRCAQNGSPSRQLLQMRNETIGHPHFLASLSSGMCYFIACLRPLCGLDAAPFMDPRGD